MRGEKKKPNHPRKWLKSWQTIPLYPRLAFGRKDVMGHDKQGRESSESRFWSAIEGRQRGSKLEG